MNLLEAGITVNGDVTVSFAGSTFTVPAEALAAYPRLRAYNGRTVVAGLRSQYLHPVSERADLPTLTGQVGLVEALGGESIVYFHVDATSVREKHQPDEDEEQPVSEEGVVAARPNLVAQFPAHVQLQLKSEIPVGVDVAKMHFFDGETGDPLR
jgi:ABC-type sugar transport system ATPase subunit